MVFVIGIEKIGVLHFSRVRFILRDFLFLTIGHLREPSDEKDFCEGLNFGRVLRT